MCTCSASALSLSPSFFLPLAFAPDGPRPTQNEIISLRASMLLFLKQLILKVSPSRLRASKPPTPPTPREPDSVSAFKGACSSPFFIFLPSSCFKIEAQFVPACFIYFYFFPSPIGTVAIFKLECRLKWGKSELNVTSFHSPHSCCCPKKPLWITRAPRQLHS